MFNAGYYLELVSNLISGLGIQNVSLEGARSGMDAGRARLVDWRTHSVAEARQVVGDQ